MQPAYRGRTLASTLTQTADAKFANREITFAVLHTTEVSKPTMEWIDEGGLKKQPYSIRRKSDRPSLLASIAQFAGGEHNGMVDVHDRRPVVLSGGLAREWVSSDTSKEQAEQLILNLGEQPDVFEWQTVSAALGNVRNYGSNLILPVTHK